MDCHLVQKHLGAYIDGELEASPAIELENHLEGCSECLAEATLAQGLKAGIRSQMAAVEAPVALRGRIERALDGVTPGAERGGTANSLSTLALAAAALLVVGVFGVTDDRAGSALTAGSGMQLPVLQEVVQRHKDELPVDVEVREPERATTWFRSRLGFRVRPVLNQPDAELVGARISYVASQQAAKLYYRVGDSRVTAVVFRATPDMRRVLGPGAAGVRQVTVGGRKVAYQNIQGYTVPVFEDGGLVYAFTGDLDESRLLRLAASAKLPR